LNHFIISASITSLCSFVAAAYLWALHPAERVNRIAALYWFSIGFWSFFVGSQFRTISLLSPFWWGWLLHLGCTFIPVLFFHFALVLTGRISPNPRNVLIPAYGVTLAFNLLNLWTPSFTHGTAYRDAYAYPQPAFLYPFYFAFFITLVIWGTALLIRYRSSRPSRARGALNLLLTTHVLAYLGGMDNFLIMADIRLPPLYPYGLYLIPPYAIATMYTMRRLQRVEIPAEPAYQETARGLPC